MTIADVLPSVDLAIYLLLLLAPKLLGLVLLALGLLERDLLALALLGGAALFLRNSLCLGKFAPMRPLVLMHLSRLLDGRGPCRCHGGLDGRFYVGVVLEVAAGVVVGSYNSVNTV